MTAIFALAAAPIWIAAIVCLIAVGIAGVLAWRLATRILAVWKGGK